MAGLQDASCYFETDGDLLGLGVRIGTYLQALSAIANLKLDAEDAPGSAWVSVFTVVPIMALALKYVLQGVISNGMFLATAYIGWVQLLIMPSVLLMPAIRCFKLLVALMYTAILFTTGLLLWYWAVGYERLELQGCGKTTAFFFAQVPAFGWFRYVNLAALGLVSILFLALFLFVWSGRAMARLQPLNQPLRLGLFLVVMLVIMVLGTELTLHWNNMEGVYSLNSTGQLIPMMAGIGAVTRDAYFFWARRQACSVDLPHNMRGRLADDGGPAVTTAQAAALPGFPAYKV